MRALFAFYIALIAGIISGVGALAVLASRKGDRWPLRREEVSAA